MPRRSPAGPHRARSGEPGAWLPAPSLRRDQYAPDQAHGSSEPPCDPPAAGTDAPAAIRPRPWRSRSVYLSDFHHTPVFQLRVLESELDGFIIIGRLDRVVAAQNLLGLTVGSIGRFGLACDGSNHAPRVVRKAFAVPGEGFLRPGKVFFGGFLHFLRAEFHPDRRFTMKKEHVLWHCFFSYCTRLYCAVSLNFGLPLS